MFGNTRRPKKVVPAVIISTHGTGSQAHQHAIVVKRQIRIAQKLGIISLRR